MGSGLSLVELLVAMALGVMLSFGATKVLLHSKRSFLEAEEQARLQENGRYALRLLAHELTMAGYLATLLPGTAVSSAESGSACFDYLMSTDHPLEQVDDVTGDGESGSGGHNLPEDCLLAGKHLAGSDLLLARRTLSAPVTGEGGDPPAAAADTIYLRVAAEPDTPLLQRGGDGAAADTQLWEYLPQLLFLRNYSVASGDGIPALCRKRVSKSANSMAPTQCLVEGIENLQLVFGIDETGDELVDRFEAAPSPAELADAVAARIYLLVRSVRPVPGHVDDRSYVLGATRVAAAGDGYYRRLMQTTVLLRNRGRLSP